MVASSGSNHPAAYDTYVPVLENAGVKTVVCKTPDQLITHGDEFAPNVIHVHSSDLISFALTIGERARIPVVATCHGLDVAKKAPCIKHVSKIIAVGNRVRDQLHEDGILGATVITNGVDTLKFRPSSRLETGQSISFYPSLRVAYVGRIDDRKRRGLSELIKAMSEIPRVQLHLAANMTVDHPNVTCYGWVADPSRLMRECDVVVGTGRAIREGLASGAVTIVLGETYGGVVSPKKALQLKATEFDFSGKNGSIPLANQIRPDLIRLIQNDVKTIELKRWSRLFACACFSIRRVFLETSIIYREAIREHTLNELSV